jgi:hypothetical protein
MNEFQEGYRPRINLIKNAKSNFPADSPISLKKRKNYFSQLLNVHQFSDLRPTEICKAIVLVPGSHYFGGETATEMLKG